ncbi:hypothetical protein ILUMI_04405 [Ignelater luminosus]|uniref:CHK kinase-like domain-containing protein n=1 Tax=Ignelater luminosus TaxID=2038154 RepID=A0A8K0DCN8_IGNLU|nr:hypothetical protein ILUMI_04405 [Ignelater luminosus]
MSNINNLKVRVDNQIQFLLKALVEEEGFQNYKIEKAPGAIKGDGYLGLITAICVTGKTNSGKEKTLHLVVKSASKSDAVRVETPLSNVFDREIYMYNTVIPAFRRFEKERNLSPFSSSAKCYKACMIEKSEAIVLQNLKEAGYSMWERRLPMEHDHISLVMTEYGRFHAISLAMKDQVPERFQKLTDSMYDIFAIFMEKASLLRMFKKQCIRALDSLDSIIDKNAYTAFKTFIDRELDEFLNNLPKAVDKYSVVLHGDCWTNNMMFKYENKDDPKKPTKMCLIDFQIARLGSPILDLSYFLYSCGSKEVLNNYEYYMDEYHNSLSTHLRQLGSNPEKLYPYSVFREQWKKFSRFGLIVSVLLVHIMLSEENEVCDFTEIAESGKSVSDAFDYAISNSEVYNDRARHIILHFVNNRFI